MYRPSQTPRLTLSSEGIVTQYVGNDPGTRDVGWARDVNPEPRPNPEPYETIP